jgi:hypothetical protein
MDHFPFPEGENTKSILRRPVVLASLLVIVLIVMVQPLTRAAVSAGSANARNDNANTLSAAEKAQGWKLLFDGKTTDGWRRFKGKTIGDKWKVIDGTLVLKPKDGKVGGDIVTVDQYDNFELSLEWRIASGGNSGIMYRVTETASAPYETGPEYQLLDNKKHPDGRSLLTSAASCYALYAPSIDMTKPVGEWNHTRLIVNGNHVEHWLNGEKVVTYELGSPDWEKRVQASKFKAMSRFGKEPKGHIDLQDHGDEVAFRNIKIRRLAQK